MIQDDLFKSRQVYKTSQRVMIYLLFSALNNMLPALAKAGLSRQ